MDQVVIIYVVAVISLLAFLLGLSCSSQTYRTQGRIAAHNDLVKFVTGKPNISLTEALAAVLGEEGTS